MLLWSIRPDSIDLLFHSSSTLIIKKFEENVWNQKKKKLNYFFLRILHFHAFIFACFPFYFYSSWPDEMGLGNIGETTNQLSLAMVDIKWS